MTSIAPLDAPATRSAIEALSRDGILDSAARADALETLAAEAAWWRPLSFLLAALGTALMLAGVIYFFAANWSGLSRFEKLGLAAFLLAAVLGLAFWKGIDSQAGRIALLSATVLTGAFLAVFGQVYQTGADAWQLFAAWSLLTLPFMLVARFMAHAVTWLVVTQVAIGTAWAQELHPDSHDFPAGLSLTLALLNLGAMVSFVWLGQRGEGWAASRWARLLLLGATLCGLVLPTCMLIVAPGDATWAAGVAALLAVPAIAASWWWHRKVWSDLAALALTALAGVSILLTAVGRPLFELSDEWPTFILFGLIVSAAVGGVTSLLRREQREQLEPTRRP